MTDLYRLLPEEMEQLVIDMGYPRYRADQILLPLYYKFPKEISELKQLPKTMREELIEQFCSNSKLKLNTISTLLQTLEEHNINPLEDPSWYTTLQDKSILKHASKCASELMEYKNAVDEVFEILSKLSDDNIISSPVAHTGFHRLTKE